MTDLTPEQQKAIDKIRAVLQHVHHNANEHEADNAATRVLKLLATHNLTMEQVENAGKPKGKIVSDEETIMAGSDWRAFLAASTARLYFCEHHIENVFPENIPDTTDGITVEHILGLIDPKHRHVFHGREHNVIVAKEMFVYFVQTIEDLARKARQERGSRTHALDDIPSQDAHRRSDRRFELAFQYGCAKRLAIRLDEKWFDLTRSPQTQALAGNNLPALYKQNDQEVKDYVASKYKGELMPQDEGQRPRDLEGMFLGFVQGKGIGLDTQVQKDKPKGRLT